MKFPLHRKTEGGLMFLSWATSSKVFTSADVQDSSAQIDTAWKSVLCLRAPPPSSNYCMARNFRRTKFSQFSRICLRPQKFYPQHKPHPFPAKSATYFEALITFGCLANVCAMAMHRYFSSVDKLRELPDPTGFLSTKVPSSSIVLANVGVKSVLKSLLAKGKGLCQAVAQCW